MPKQKKYPDRKAFTLRFSYDVYNAIERRAQHFNLSLQAYFDKLVEEDLIIANIEERKALIDAARSGANK